MLKGKVFCKEFIQLKKWIVVNLDQDEYLVFVIGGNINKIYKLLGLKDEELVKFLVLKKLQKELELFLLEVRMDQFYLKFDWVDVIIFVLEIFIFCLKEIGVKFVFVFKIGLLDGMIYDFDL